MGQQDGSPLLTRLYRRGEQPPLSPLASIALIFDIETEQAAFEAANAFKAVAELTVLRMDWEPYEKFGAQSRITLWVRLDDDGQPQSIIDEVERICGCVAAPAHLKTAHLMCHFNEDQSFHYERIFDAREHGLAIEALTWMQVELNTATPAQIELQRSLGERC
jgi:hypothetical protein